MPAELSRASLRSGSAGSISDAKKTTHAQGLAWAPYEHALSGDKKSGAQSAPEISHRASSCCKLNVRDQMTMYFRFNVRRSTDRRNERAAARCCATFTR